MRVGAAKQWLLPICAVLAARTGAACSDRNENLGHSRLGLEDDSGETGAVDIEASVALAQQGPLVCPGILTFSVIPSAVLVSQPAQLTLLTTQPTPVVSWTIQGGSIDGETEGDGGAVSWLFHCSAAGTAFVTVAVELPDSDICNGQNFTSYTTSIACQ
jgi:hypothetical protein